MRNLVHGINVTLDGCFDHTKQIGGDEILEYFKRGVVVQTRWKIQVRCNQSAKIVATETRGKPGIESRA